MRILNFLLMFFLLIFISLGLYILWSNLPTQEKEIQKFQANYSQNIPAKSSQFYANMRYPDKIIGYYISPSCNQKQKTEATQAFEEIQQKTILEFYQLTQEEHNSAEIPEISITCSNIAPTLEEQTHFVAGEGGPTEIINITAFNVILSGKVALYRTEQCKTPKVAVHEILHALGFDHNNNESSIMYPFTECDQKIDNYIIEEINEIYQTPSNPDLSIDYIDANKSGRYLNFEILVSNIGLKKAEESKIVINSEKENIKNFALEELPIGTKRKITVTNLKIPSNTNNLTFYVESSQEEISKKNNKVVLSF